MTPADIAALGGVITGLTGLVTAIAAMIHSVRTRQQASANHPVSLPHADTERAESRDVPIGFSPPDCRA